MKSKDIECIFKTFHEKNPQPTTELTYHSVFELLISVILSAQATDISVNKATAVLFPIANTPEAILALGEEGLKPYIQRIGLHQAKGRHIIQTCARLIEHHDGEVPSTREELESLPGVGRKTANVILNTAFGESTIAVDTHIFRVANRTGMALGKTPLEVEQKLMKVIPPAYLKEAHHWLVLHGRYVCKAKKPECDSCTIQPFCLFSTPRI